MNYPLSIYHLEESVFTQTECKEIINHIDGGRDSGAPLMLPNIEVESYITPEMGQADMVKGITGITWRSNHKFWDVLDGISWVGDVDEGDRTFLRYEKMAVNQCHNDLYDNNKVTCIFFLNDDYDGGELVLYTWSKDTCTFPVRLKPTTGSVIIFPSFLYHSVSEITGGVRYVYSRFFK